MAHVEKRGQGRWRARYRGPDGKERSRTFPRRVDAERWLTGIEHSKLTGGYIDPSAGKITFRTFAEEWRSRQVQRAGTAVSVEQQLRLHVYPVIGGRPIAAIRPGEIQGLVQRLDERLAPTTVGVVYGRVVAVFRGAVRDRVVTASPCVDVRLPTTKPASMLKVLSTEEVLAMADAVPARYGALIITGAGTGLRPGELFGLAWDRADFLRRTIRVDQQLMRVRGEGVALGPLKTPSSYRTLPLPQVVADAMAAHLAAWPAHPDLGVVFTNERAEPIQQQPFASVWETAQRKSGLPEWATPHDLRHYFASVLIRSGASVKVVQARLGHASAKTTLDIYSHLFGDEEDRTRAAIDLELGAPAASPRPEQTLRAQNRRSDRPPSQMS
jgi:integrase